MISLNEHYCKLESMKHSYPFFIINHNLARKQNEVKSNNVDSSLNPLQGRVWVRYRKIIAQKQTEITGLALSDSALCRRSGTNPNPAGCKMFFHETSYFSLILLLKFTNTLLGGFWLPLGGTIYPHQRFQNDGFTPYWVPEHILRDINIFHC